MRAAFCAVAVLALACLLLRASRVGLAGDYLDPIGKVTAQDEALYAHSAIRMARQGGWLTPKFMGRYALYKPPLLAWTAGISARLLGVSRFSLRLPTALACSLALGLIFLWAAELRSWQAGACAALLAASNHLWHVLGSMALTDGLLVAFYTAALYCLFYDPWLESRGAMLGFAASVAGAILDKSVAGVLPLGALALYWLAAPRTQRPAFWRVCLAGTLPLVLAAPWFVYQMAAHPRWFWTEQVRVEILGFGAGAPPQTSGESQFLFYLMRAAAVDPLLTALALASLPAFAVALRKRSAEAVLLFSWLAVFLAAVAGWRYRNLTYLLPLVPALAILAAVYNPLATLRRGWWMLPLAAVAFLGKAALPTAPFGLSFARGTIQPQAAALSNYCEARGQQHELILVGMDDDLYAAALPLPRIRYALVRAGVTDGGPYGMPFGEMGIILSAAQFNDLPRWEPVFRQRLREWGLDSAEPIGTLILAQSVDELAQVIQAHPESDFFLPRSYHSPAQFTHQTIDAGDHVFLFSRQGYPHQAIQPAWPCGL